MDCYNICSYLYVTLPLYSYHYQINCINNRGLSINKFMYFFPRLFVDFILPHISSTNILDSVLCHNIPANLITCVLI